MSCEVRWNKLIYETFVREAKLNPLETEIMERHVAKQSRVQISMDLCISLATLDRHIKRIKQRYDDVQPYNSDVLPPRMTSAYRRKTG